MSFALFLAVSLAGGLGAATRFSVDSAILNRFRMGFPWVTLAINVSGSFALGLLTSLAAGTLLPGDWALALGAGFLGGYTTFSTTSNDSLRLLQEKRYGASLGNLMGTLAAAVAAAALGLGLGSLF